MAAIQRTRPLTVTESQRKILLARTGAGDKLDVPQEIVTTKDHLRIWRSSVCLGPAVWLGEVVDEAAMLALHSTHPRGCYPVGDQCRRLDTEQVFQCVSGNGTTAADWIVVSEPPAAWGGIGGSITDQPDLAAAISGLSSQIETKANPAANATTLAKITESGGAPLWDGGDWPGGGGGGVTTIDSTSLRHWWPLQDFYYAPRKCLADNANGQLTSNSSVGVDFGLSTSKRSARFTGSNFLSRSSNSTLQIGGGSFSATLWVAFNSVANSGLLAKWDYSDNQREWLISYSSGTFRFSLWNSANTAGTACNATTTGAASVGVWYHVAATYDSSIGTMRIYINGTLDGSATHAGGTRNGTARFLAGASGVTSTTQETLLNGWLAEASIWGRLLTAGEVATLYGGGGGAVWPFTAP